MQNTIGASPLGTSKLILVPAIVALRIMKVVNVNVTPTFVYAFVPFILWPRVSTITNPAREQSCKADATSPKGIAD